MTKMNPVGTLWTDAWKLYGDFFTPMTQLFAIPLVLIGIGDIFRAIGGTPMTIVSALASVVGEVLLFIMTAAAIYAYDKKCDASEAYKNGIRFFWPMVWVSILTMLALLGGFVLAVIPGIWLAIAFTFMNYTLILEGKKGMTALAASHEYVRGYWWAVTGRFLLLVLLAFVGGIVVGVPFAIIGGPIGGAVATAVIQLFIVPFSLAYSYLMYRNLASLKPDVAAKSAIAETTFVRVAQVIGLVFVALIIAAAAIFLGAAGSAHYESHMDWGPSALR